MDEFIKLGGYLVEGQPEVAHDSALSGNGLEDSPLGISQQFITDVVNSASQSALSARSAYTALYDENGYPITGYLTAIPDPITIGVQEGDTLDTDYDGLKIVKATANGNEHINLHKKSTDQWLIHGNLVPTSPGSNKYLVTDDSGAMHWDNKSALAYDSAFEQSGGYITAYNGSAFKAGDEFPQSATDAIETVTANSADWNGTTETVSSNSGAWGGSALPVSAGPGIKFEMVDNTLVASTDETILFFAGNDSSGAQTGNLTESIMNFERIRVAGMDNDGHIDVKYIYPAWTKNADNFDATGYEVMLYGANPVQNTVWEKWTRYSFSALTSFNVVLSYEGSYTANSISDVTNSHKNSIREVVGINRIAGGN